MPQAETPGQTGPWRTADERLVWLARPTITK